ncbi:hypothetical protein ACRAR1_09305 [Streptomyces sanyensis]|uniref:hypothetical protein n=1 Tax=Streptomyces sanyensis TaxID=568869 RepID=UPI003D782D3C
MPPAEPGGGPAPASGAPAPAPARPGSTGTGPARTGPARAEEPRSTASASTAPLRDRFASGHRAPGPPRRGGDPVKGLLHRHRELCADAVDPLEIAAGLEAHGVTDRTAAHYRHRDVFSLAEEMFARTDRTPRSGPAAPVPPEAAQGADGLRGPGPGPLLRAAAPAAVCALAVVGAEAAGEPCGSPSPRPVRRRPCAPWRSPCARGRSARAAAQPPPHGCGRCG